MTLTEILSVEVKLFSKIVTYDDVERCGADSGTFYVECRNGEMFWHNQRDWVSAHSVRRWERDDA